MRINKEICTSILLVLHASAVNSDLTKHRNYHLLDHEDCGSSVSGRILGGMDAELGQYPWMALLGLNKSGNDEIEPTCGGAVISKRYVLTAAHCVQRDAESLTLILGEYKLDDDPDCVDGLCAPPVQRLRVEKTLGHQGYDHDDKTSLHDIALIRTTIDIQFNDFLQPICLPLYVLSDTIGTAEVAGWGSNSKYGTLSLTSVLQRLLVNVVPSDECPWQIQAGQICVATGRSQDSCNGDSGGPLMKALSLPHFYGPRYFIMGVLSYGHPICAFSKTPKAVYTNVSAYMEWILDSIEP